MDNTLVISDAEWEVMRVLWTLGPQKSQRVIDVLTNKMQWQPSTIKTLLSRLVKKGALATEKIKRSFVYSTTVDEQTMMNRASESLFDHMCAMKSGAALTETINRVELSQQDIKTLQAVLANKALTAPEKVACNCVSDVNCE